MHAIDEEVEAEIVEAAVDEDVHDSALSQGRAWGAIPAAGQGFRPSLWQELSSTVA